MKNGKKRVVIRLWQFSSRKIFRGHKKNPDFFRDRVVFWALKIPLKEWEVLTIFRRAWLF